MKDKSFATYAYWLGLGASGWAVLDAALRDGSMVRGSWVWSLFCLGVLLAFSRLAYLPLGIPRIGENSFEDWYYKVAIFFPFVFIGAFLYGLIAALLDIQTVIF